MKQERNRFRHPFPNAAGAGLGTLCAASDPISENNMNQRVGARWRTEVQEAMCSVQRRSGWSRDNLLNRMPRAQLVEALAEAIWAQRAAYARLSAALETVPELMDESM